MAKLTDPPKYSAIVVEAKTGEVLYARYADSERYPASITKLMTLYLAFDALDSGEIKLSDRIKISKSAAGAAPSKLGLKAGETISVDNAIRAIAVKSANDVALAMAEHLAGNERRFAALMTIKARELGMKHSRFVNASGLPDERQLSSARDIAILSRALMRNHANYYGYFSVRSFVWRGTEMPNHNRLLGNYRGVDGLKTGYTVASGFNLAASAVRDGHRIIAVVLGGRTAAARDTHMADLLDSAFTLLDKRAKGDRTAQIASVGMGNTPDPVAAMIAASAEEGSTSERRGVKIVMDSAVEEGDGGDDDRFLPDTPVKRVASVKKAVADLGMPDETPSAAAAPKAKTAQARTAVAAAPAVVASLPSGKASIQIGAFDREADAKDKLRKIQKSYGDRMALSSPVVTPTTRNGKTLYRARFTGYSLKDAGNLCRTLQGEGQHCFATSVE